jgi:RHS repeat-associated protein
VECKALTYQNFLFLEVAHQKNATEKFILGLYKDHLWNVRLSYADADGNGSVTSVEIREENNYYPFGLKHKEYNNIIQNSNSAASKYKYQGKELQEELGLDWYDFGARNYDASLGRWMNIDPLAEKFYNVSPYNAMMNNPIGYIDPDGREAKWKPEVNSDGSTKYIAEKGDNASTLASQYGITQKDAESITGTKGDSKIKEGTSISGKKVKEVTGNEIMKFDPNSKLATDQKMIDHIVFAMDHTNKNENIAFSSTDFFKKTMVQTFKLDGTIKVDDKDIAVNVQYRNHRAVSTRGASTSTLSGSSPFRVKPTSGKKYKSLGGTDVILFPAYHPDSKKRNASWMILTPRPTSGELYDRFKN